MGDISELSNFKNIITHFSSIKSNMTDIQGQIHTGKSISSMAQLAKVGKAEILLSLQSDSSKYDGYYKTCEDSLMRIESITKQLDMLTEIAQNLSSELTLLNSSSESAMNYETIAVNTLRQIENILNTTFDNKYIFSGNSPFDPPVEPGYIVDNSNVVDGNVTNNYYQGGLNNTVAVVGDNYPISYGITADNEAFQNLIAAVHMARQAVANTGNQEKQALKNKAIEFISNATKKLSQLTSGVGNSQLAIERQVEILEQTTNYVNDNIDNIQSADVVEAMILYHEYLNMMQATIKVTTMLNGKHLQDYL